MIKFLSVLCFCFILQNSNAQFTRYIVKFKDKAGTPHSIATPSTYLSAKSIARRTRFNILIDSTDLPITPRYLDSIRIVPNVTIINYSKWLNQVAIITNSTIALAKINGFSFVQGTNPIAVRQQTSTSLAKLNIDENPITTRNSNDITRTNLNYGNSFNQINLHNGQFLHDQGFLGQGITIAVMDAGFNSHLTNTGIDSLRINNQIKGTWDFVANEASVNEDDAHGFYCLSILGANKPNVMIGSAPKADYYLYRTEDVGSEYPIEEQNWIAAAERADSIGVDVFSTSLGYIDFDNASFDYGYPQRNGNTAMMTKAGDLAAKKGILVCNSAGNNGNGSASFVDFKYVAIPADGDSVMAVGSCTAAGSIASSSAWGPAFGGRIKPNVTSLGQGASFINLSGNAANGNGTSFSNPNMAGLVANLWQAFPELNNMGILDITQQAGSIATAPDGRFGYGIPNMKKAFVLGLKRVHISNPVITNCTVAANFSAKDNGTSTYTLERQLPSVVNFVPVQTINATAGSFALKNYILRDTLPAANIGTITYRIKHTMGADTTFYYNNFTVNYTTPCVTPITTINTYSIKIAPNPVKSNLFVQFGTLASNKMAVKITNANGALVFSKNYTTQYPVNIATATWSKGMYTVEVLDNKKTIYVKKVVKE
jgi:hypothetical protein